VTNLEHLPLEERQLVWSELEDQPTVDNRFRDLMGDREWEKLPLAVQRRFSRHIEDGQSVVYKGVITKMEANFAGKLLAQFCRIIGAPLPFEAQENGTPAIVTVTEDKAGNGQFWTRTYGRKTGFPQVIHSSKRFEGKTGLEEYIGYAITMDLKAIAERDAIVFASDGYHFNLFGLKLDLPKFLEPGQVKVSHVDQGEGYFAFVLEVTHRSFGKMIHQRGIFCEHEVVIV